MKRVLLTVLSTLLAASVPTAADAARPGEITDTATAATFSYRLSRGLSQRLETNIVIQTEELAGRRSTEHVFNARFGYTWEVQSVGDDGTATVANSLTNAEANYTIAGEREDTTEIVNAMRGARLSHQVTSTGTLINATGTLETEEQIGNIVHDIISSAWVQFPAEPVSPGDIWLQSIPRAVGLDTGSIQAGTTAQYTLAGYANVGGARHAVIDVVYATRLDGLLEDEGGSGQRVELLGRGAGTAYVLFNMATHRVTEVSGNIGDVMTGTLISGSRVQTAYSISFHVSAMNAGDAPSAFAPL
ncbi:MAG: hypothetical protein ACI81R_000715 [Bradymonadia bacterium]|jgi:hypothetical protein